MKKMLKKLIAMTVIFGAIGINLPTAAAAGVDVQTTNRQIDLSTTETVTLEWDASSTYANGQVITVSAHDNLDTLSCSGSAFDADGNGTDDACVDNGDTLTITLDSNGSHLAPIDLPVQVQDSTKGDYYLSINVNNAGNDYGTVLIYVDNSNWVDVEVDVPASISLDLSTNTCDMGLVGTTTMGECNYNVAFGTNNPNGAEVKAMENNELRNTGGTADIDDESNNSAGRGDNDKIIVEGSEEYGFGANQTTASATVGTTNVVAAYENQDDDHFAFDVPESEVVIADSVGAPIDNGQFEVTHRVTVNQATAADHYFHKVEWYAYPKF